VQRIVAGVSEIFAGVDAEGDSADYCWRKVLFVIEMMRKTTVGREKDPQKAVTGARLSELMELLAQAAEAETPEDPGEVPAPGRIARLVFRMLAAFSTRQDHGPERGAAQSSAWRRMGTAIRFARGAGQIPQTHGAMGNVSFAAAEEPLGELSDEANALLARWTRVKIESGQFCGPTNFHFMVWDGLESLALSFATAMWLARVLKQGGRSVDDSVTLAVRIVDDNFGFNPFLARRQRFGLSVLGFQRQELARLVAHYGR
jgi:lysine-N-methylase